MRTSHFVLLAAAVASSAPAATTRGSGEVANFSFEECAGPCAVDSASGLEAMLSPAARWASGSFGGALATGWNGACAYVDGLQDLDGADACTVFVRFRKTGAGAGRYPNLLTSLGWGSKGGLMLFSPGGKSLALRLRAGANGPEAQYLAFKSVPQGKWSSVAFVFRRPDVTVYADGKAVTRGRWDHPLAVGGTIQLGGWDSDSFGGFIDDFRVWRRALAESDIADLAGDSRYDEIEGYQDDGTGGVRKTVLVDQGGASLATVECDVASLVMDACGRVSSLKEKSTDRELVTNAVPFVEAVLAGNRRLAVRRAEKRGEGRFAFLFGKAGEVVVAVRPFTGGWIFSVEDCSLAEVRSFELCRLQPVCSKWKGSFANAWSDEASAVCVRSCDIMGNPRESGTLRVVVEAPFSPKGRSAALAAGPRSGFREQLKAMTIAAGAPRSDSGGAWSMDSEVSRWSYVFTSVQKGDIDSWIDFVKRSGFSNLHINSSWTSCLGHCPVSKAAFPGGLDEMKACVEKVHAAGLHAGMHTLTACISPCDPWITPVCSEDLVADATYTLAAPLEDGASEMLVEEKPIGKHVTVFTYSSNGNVFRIGGELIQYTGIRGDKPPYAFTGLKRGAFGTKRGGTYPAGTKADYLHQRYIAFYPKPDSRLADELASRLAEVYNACNLDEFYFDGSEGMGTRYGIDAMRHRIFSKLKPNNGHSPSIEASCDGANNWWFQTRMATVDHGVYGVKRFHDWHITWAIGKGRMSNFLEPQMGWWMPRTDVPRARGHMLDEMEYFAGKNAGHDAAMSVQGVSPRQGVTGVRRQLTVLGWYEWPRLARAFRPEARAYLAKPRAEARLRQDADGEWKLVEVEALAHRAGSPWLRSWSAESATSGPAALRVEALYAAGEDGDGTVLLAADEFKSMTTGSAAGVEVAFAPEVGGEKGKAFRLSASNRRAERRGAWAMAKKTFGFSGADLGEGRIAFGTWVRGDGSGALLNLQFSTPDAFTGGVSDHLVRLDFTGWRYITVLLRERDAEHFSDYIWPYGGYAHIYRSMVNPRHLGAFTAYLNDIPKGGSAAVEIGEVRALDMASSTMENAVVAVNGETFGVPFPLKSGEYAELDGGFWTHYSAMGDAIERVPGGATPAIKAGRNDFSFDGGERGRAEVTAFAFGRTLPAFVDELTPEMRGTMRYEGMMPFEYAPAKGLLPPKAIPVRPGEKAAMSLDVYGPATRPTFTFRRFFGFSKTECAFDAEIKSGERLLCRDGRTWRVERLGDGATVKEGSLAEPLPLLDGTTDFEFSAELSGDTPCVVDILKEYK